MDESSVLHYSIVQEVCSMRLFALKSGLVFGGVSRVPCGVLCETVLRAESLSITGLEHMRVLKMSVGHVRIGEIWLVSGRGASLVWGVFRKGCTPGVGVCSGRGASLVWGVSPLAAF